MSNRKLHEQMVDEIERAIADKAEEISNIAATLREDESEIHRAVFRKKITYIKMMVSYCKRISNFIILSRQSPYLSTEELVRALREMLWDSEVGGVEYAVVFREAGKLRVEEAVFFYKYIYQIIEKAMHYKKPIIFINLSEMDGKIRIKLLISAEGETIRPEDFELTKASEDQLEEKGYLQHLESDHNSVAVYLLGTKGSSLEKEEGRVEVEKERSSEEVQKEETILELKNRVHDVMGQRLSIIHRILEENKYIHLSVKEFRNLLDTMLRDVREKDIEEPIRLFESMKRSCHLIRVRLTLQGEFIGSVKQQHAMIQVIREAVTNAVRHGKAKNIEVSIERDDRQIRVTIQNDGERLMQPPVEKDGIIGMRRRAQELGGELEITIDPVFCVTMKLPVSEE